MTEIDSAYFDQWRKGALHAPSPGEPLALWNEGRIALGAFLGSLRQDAPVAEAQPETELRTPANDTMEEARMSA